MKRVIELLRVSTESQAGDKASIPSQRATNRQTALQYDLTIVKTIELSDVSGAQVLLAPEIQEMLRLMNDPEIHGVIVTVFDRLMRPENFGDYAMLQAFVDTESLLYLPDGPIDFATDAGMLTGTMRAVMGGLERRELVKKMWRIKEQRRRDGGFSQSAVCLPFGVGFNGTWFYTPDAERASEAFRLVLGGSTSYTAIARSTGIHAYNLRNILRNPIYTGWRVIDKRRDPSPKAKKAGKDGRQGDRPKINRAPEDVIRVKVMEALVSESDFNQVQRILDLKKANHWRTRDDIVHRFTYNGYLTCLCQHLVYTKFRRDDYYVCSKRCGVGYMRRDRLDPQIDQLFTKRLTSPAFLKRHILAPLRQKRQPDSHRAQLTAQLDALAGKRQRILDSYFEGVINSTERDLRLASLNRERGIIQGLIAKDRPRPELDLETLANLFSVFTEFDLLNREDKRQLLNTITPSIVVANYKVEGMWIGHEVSHTAAVYNGNDRIWLQLAA